MVKGLKMSNDTWSVEVQSPSHAKGDVTIPLKVVRHTVRVVSCARASDAAKQAVIEFEVLFPAAPDGTYTVYVTREFSRTTLRFEVELASVRKVWVR